MANESPMAQLKAELRLLFYFLKAHVPKLSTAILQSHGTPWRRVIRWEVAMITLAQLAGLLNLFWHLTYSVLTSLHLSLFWGLVYGTWILSIFCLSGYVGGLWTRKQSPDPEFSWNSWWEFFFLCFLPINLSHFLVGILASATFSPISIGMLISAYSFGRGLLHRFHVPKTWVALILVCLGLPVAKLIHSGPPTPSFSTMPVSLTSTSSYDFKRLPPDIEERLKKKYSSNEKQMKAVLQSATADWRYMDDDIDLKTRDYAQSRAIACIWEVFGDSAYETDQEISAMVHHTTALVKRMLEVDHKFNGKILWPFAGENPCDP
jgi:hypothetical protein